MLRIRNLLQTRFLHRQAREMQKQLETVPAARRNQPPNPGRPETVG